MRFRPLITAAVLGAVCAVSAQQTVCVAADSQKSASGLISKCMLSCSGSGGMLDIYAKTQSTMVMDNIGFNDIVLQKSSDGTDWTDALSLGSVVHSDLRYYTYSAQIKVDGGYFYRVTCIHYAEGTPYRSNATFVQTAENTSKSFFMESDQGSHGAAETTPQVTYTTSAQPVTQVPAIPTTAVAANLPEPPVTTTLTAAAIPASATTGNTSAKNSAGSPSASTVVTSGTATTAVSTASSKAETAKEAGPPTTGTSAPAAAAVTVIAASAVVRRTRKK